MHPLYKHNKIIYNYYKLWCYLIRYKYTVNLFHKPDKSSKDRYHREHQRLVFTSNTASVERFYDAYLHSCILVDLNLKVHMRIIRILFNSWSINLTETAVFGIFSIRKYRGGAFIMTSYPIRHCLFISISKWRVV